MILLTHLGNSIQKRKRDGVHETKAETPKAKNQRILKVMYIYMGKTLRSLTN